MGLLEQVAELSRSSLAQDNKFWRKMLYFFELQVPASVSPTRVYRYPLIIPPDSLRMTEPFQVDRSFTNGGGLFVEEQGMVAREIFLSGTTGWAPKRHPLLFPVSNPTQFRFPRNKSFTRTTANNPQQLLLPLSGQRHFQFLQDTVFRTYADLKQDHSTSVGTRLYFHNIKDSERWRVIPLEFSLSRDASKPLEYRYDIHLLAVPPGKGDGFDAVVDDDPVISTLKDPLATLRVGLAAIDGALQDLGSVQGELRSLNGQFDTLFSTATTTSAAVTRLLNGTVDLIDMPFTSINTGIDAGLSAMNELFLASENVANSVLFLPDNVLNTLRKLTDALAIVGSYPERFQSSIDAAVAKFKQRQSLVTARSAGALQQAATAEAPATLRAFDNQGTALMPGDYARSQNALGLGSATPRYTSAIEYVIEQGDSLASLAAKYLGDARNWKFIAVFNNLNPPFISTSGIPGTLGVGDRILIPSFDDPATSQDNPAVLGVRPEEAAQVHALGRDLLVVDAGKGLYDLVIDEAGGSVDVKVVAGIPNLQQAIRSRIITERGTDLLYKELGTSRIVGLGLDVVDFETAQFRLLDSVQADPRISGIRSMSFQTEQADSVVAEIEAEVRGFTKPEKISVTAAKGL